MYVVTGATSRTGSVVARALLQARIPVRVIGRNRARLQPLVEAGAEAFVAEPTDAGAMERAFAGADSAWVMLQPNYIPDSPDFRGFQTAVINAVAPALGKAGVRKIVSLSSWGADLESGTGPVIGLHNLEQALNRLDSDVLHLRAGYYMENLLAYVDAVAGGKNATGPFRGDVRMPLIATDDVGAVGGQVLLDGKFTGKSTRELQGAENMSLDQAISVVARLMERPDLRYEQIPLEIVVRDWLAAGLSQNVIELMVEVVAGINNGIIKTREPRSPMTTTPTTFEVFAWSHFIPLCEAARKEAGEMAQ